MNFRNFFTKTTVLLVCLISFISVAQEVDIKNPLKNAEEGKIELAQSELRELKGKFPNDPSVIYLDGVLTSDAKDAVVKYQSVADNHSDCKYADAANYQLYSYYYAVGNYTLAKKYHEKLKANYPKSIYVKKIENKASDIKTSDLTYAKPFDSVERKDKLSPEDQFEFTVQAGAFLVQDNANKLVKALREKGFKAEIKEKKVAGSNFFVVSTGRFKSNTDAENFLTDLKKKLNIEGRVVNLN